MSAFLLEKESFQTRTLLELEEFTVFSLVDKPVFRGEFELVRIFWEVSIGAQ